MYLFSSQTTVKIKLGFLVVLCLVEFSVYLSCLESLVLLKFIFQPLGVSNSIFAPFVSFSHSRTCHTCVQSLHHDLYVSFLTFFSKFYCKCFLLTYFSIVLLLPSTMSNILLNLSVQFLISIIIFFSRIFI